MARRVFHSAWRSSRSFCSSASRSPGSRRGCRAPGTATGRTTPPTSAAPNTRRWIKSTPANFNQLEVAWRFKTDNLGTAARVQARRHAAMATRASLYTTAGTRRSVVALDGEDRRADLGRTATARAIAPRLRRGSCRAAASRTGPTAKATNAFSTSRPATGSSRSTRRTAAMSPRSATAASSI